VRSAVADAAATPLVNLVHRAGVGQQLVVLVKTSPDWSVVTGGTSYKTTPTAVSNDTFINLGGDAGAVRLGMVPGRKYTVSATVYLPAAQTSANLHTRSRRIDVFTKIGAGGYVETLSAQPPNAAGATRLSLTFTVPVGASETFIRLYNGSDLAADVVYWDQLMVVEGTDPGFYADGNTPGWRWTGAADASTSVGYPPLDVRQMPVIAGPIDTNAAVYTVEPGVGPTGLPIGRVTRSFGPIGFGAMVAAYVPGSVIPKGSTISYSWWQRGSADLGFLALMVMNDPATVSLFAGGPNRVTNTWARVKLTITNTSADLTTGSGFNGIKLRLGLPDIAGSWIEFSDAKIHVR
jgi:hypothetical protein